MSARLSDLFAALSNATIRGPVDGTIGAIVADSRAAAPGALFVALRGQQTDGHAFVERAVAAGAIVIVVDRPVDVPAHVTVIGVADTARAASQLASTFHGDPSLALHMVGVTGTNGKTTTTHFIARAIEAAGHRCAIIGTLGASLGTQHWPLANTTPLAIELHALLAAVRDAGASHVAMEVSSHALALHRVDDVEFDVAVLTNVTRDHLDFHGTFENYAAAKRSLFTMATERILNLEDPTGLQWSRQITGALTYAIDREAAVRARSVQIGARGSTFLVDDVAYATHLPGRFNVSNALAAIAVGRTLGIDDRIAAQGIGALENVPGRMERVDGEGFTVVVDYAHTPDALERALIAAREFTPGRLAVVFGAGGDRDRGKRPVMGKTAAELADSVVVTSDNPRSEDPDAIIAEIMSGVPAARRATVETIVDRRAAIRHAVGAAREGDTILIAGKGHEPYQIIGDRTLPFDDRDEARSAIAARGARA